ncbi:hypothetical protein QQX98_001316 [Neonectria punicea]|uniref:Uncharacterized protein n=1 Tax=Neonectria punicea TaxID=979145 RepID=A0ABR1HPC8_9HYPO
MRFRLKLLLAVFLMSFEKEDDRLPHGTYCHLEVWDFPTEDQESESSGTCVRRVQVKTSSELAESFEHLPKQQESTVRVYIQESYEGNAFQSHLDQLCEEQDILRLESRAGFSSLSHQLRNENPCDWYKLEGYGLLARDGRTSATTPWAHVLRIVMLMTDKEGRPVVLISCQTKGLESAVGKWADDYYGSRYSNIEKFVSELTRLDPLYQLIRNKENWKQLFLLQCHHAHLHSLGHFVHELSMGQKDEKGTYDARLSELRPWQLEYIIQSSYAYQRLRNTSDESIEITETLLDCIKTGGSTDLKTRIEPDIHGCCKEINGRLSRLIGSLEHDLKFLDLARNVRQTDGVNRLTLLATIFLPLSLSAGVLSMGTRFRDLGNLLYDFIGVTVLLVAVVAVLLGILSLLASAKDYIRKMHVGLVFYRKHFLPVAMRTGSVCLLLLGAFCLASFLLGMFKDISLGLRTLGYGAAAAVGCVPFLGLFMLVCILNSAFKKVRRTRPSSAQEDVERDSAEVAESNSNERRSQ